MVGESNQNVFLIQIDLWKFAEFAVSEFEISRSDFFAHITPKTISEKNYRK